MKQILTLLAFALLLFAGGCARIEVESIDSELAAFLGTRSDAPLDNTVWEHNSGVQYNRYVTFRDGQMSLFYGREDRDTLHRYSEWFTAPYILKGGLIITNLTYNLYGRQETESVSVVKSKAAYIIDIDGEDYRYYGPWSDVLNEEWTTITVNIVPWSYE